MQVSDLGQPAGTVEAGRADSTPTAGSPESSACALDGATPSGGDGQRGGERGGAAQLCGNLQAAWDRILSDVNTDPDADDPEGWFPGRYWEVEELHIRNKVAEGCYHGVVMLGKVSVAGSQTNTRQRRMRDVDVAIKLVHKRDAEAVERLEEELYIYRKYLRALHGSVVPRLVAFGTTGHDQGVAFLATEWIDGEVLDPDHMSVEAAQQLLGAVGRVHACDVLHGDLWGRGNLLLERHTGRVVILDFSHSSVNIHAKAYATERFWAVDWLRLARDPNAMPGDESCDESAGRPAREGCAGGLD